MGFPWQWEAPNNDAPRGFNPLAACDNEETARNEEEGCHYGFPGLAKIKCENLKIKKKRNNQPPGNTTINNGGLGPREECIACA